MYWNVAIALLLIAGMAVSIGGETPSARPRMLRGIESPVLTATVVSVRPIVDARAQPATTSDTSAPGTSVRPAVTGGSGLAQHGGWTLVAQDDSTELAAIAGDGRVARLRLVDSVDGHDRFHPAFGNKNKKPDLEAIVYVRASASIVRRLGGDPGKASAVPAFLLFGSGSIPGVRDRVAIVLPRRPFSSSFVRVVTATGLYDALRSKLELAGGKGLLNIEAAASVDGRTAVRLYNRGNTGLGSITASIDLPTSELLEYFVAAAANPASPSRVPLRNPMHYDLGSRGGHAISIGEAITLPKRSVFGTSEAFLLAGIAEASANAVDDGATSGTVLGLQLDEGRRLLVTPVMQDGRQSALKIEGLAVTSIRTLGRGSSRRLVMRILGVVDTDSTDPAVPSDLVEIDLTYRLRGQ